MAHIFIPGGGGYVGTHLVSQLLDIGHQVTVLDSFIYGQPSLARHCRRSNFQLHLGDVRDVGTVKQLAKKADVILPLAAIVGAPACENKVKDSYETNVKSIEDLVRGLSNDQLLVFPSTNSIYGVGEAGRPCSEESAPNPISSYGKQKLAAEGIVSSHSNTIILRFATLFGLSERMRLDLLINDFVSKALFQGALSIFEGTFKRNFLHVSDAARAVNFFIDLPDPNVGEIFNVGLRDVNLSKVEICEKIQEYLPDFHFSENSHERDPDQRNYLVSNAKIEKLGYSALTSLDDGIQELIKGLPMFQNGHYSNI